MALLPISEKLQLNTEGFGVFSFNAISYFLRNIYLRTLKYSNRTSNNLPNCIINYWPNNPICMNAGSNLRMIMLSSKDNVWANWIYQFAHEICHHIIDGTMSGEIRGQKWFEETLCETNSLFQLAQAAEYDYPQLIPHHNQMTGLAIHKYLNALIQSNQDLLQSLSREGIRQWLPLLYEPQHHRDHNNAIATAILPLFLENPHLWGILSHIGDSCQYATLEDLFDHLRATADDSYRDSLDRMIKILLP